MDSAAAGGTARRPPLAVGAGILGVAGAVPLAVLVPQLGRPGGSGPFDGAMWVLLVAFPLLQAGGGVLLLCRRSWRALAFGCAPGMLLMTLLFLVSGPDLPLFAGSLAQLALSTVTVCCAAHRDVRDWVVAQRPSSAGGQPGAARSG